MASTKKGHIDEAIKSFISKAINKLSGEIEGYTPVALGGITYEIAVYGLRGCDSSLGYVCKMCVSSTDITIGCPDKYSYQYLNPIGRCFRCGSMIAIDRSLLIIPINMKARLDYLVSVKDFEKFGISKQEFGFMVVELLSVIKDNDSAFGEDVVTRVLELALPDIPFVLVV